MQWIAYMVVPLVLSMALTPLVNWVAIELGAFAQMNERTVHKGKIARIGGVAIYIAFLLSMSYFTEGIDSAIQGLLIGSSIMFFGGLVDDMVDLPPIGKLGFQMVAALVLIKVGGVELGIIHLPLGIVINMGVISTLVTFVWIIGITNAINLIDGLDGLAGGVSFIVLTTVGIISIAEGRNDIAMISFVVAGASLGFLYFNFHPAKLFMGDCGALFLGFIIAALSLMGFKGSTFITLGFPMLLLAVPIIDTLSAMLRRIVGGKKISDADKNHLHHNLMIRFGHKNTVLIIYLITIGFGLGAYVYLKDKMLGLLVIAIMFIGMEVFIEKSNMISKKFHPLTSIYNRILKRIKRLRGK